jgi:general stress protein 26
MSDDHARAEGLKHIWEMIGDIRIAMLTTANPNGSLYSRPMASNQKEFSGEFYFLTRRHSEKAEEVSEDAQVNLTYVDTHKSTFVSLSGVASLSRDTSRIHELWHPSFAAWFPGGEADPEIVVLTVRVEEAEYWDAPANSLVRNFLILKRAMTGGVGQVGEHERLSALTRPA